MVVVSLKKLAEITGDVLGCSDKDKMAEIRRTMEILFCKLGVTFRGKEWN